MKREGKGRCLQVWAATPSLRTGGSFDRPAGAVLYRVLLLPQRRERREDGVALRPNTKSTKAVLRRTRNRRTREVRSAGGRKKAPPCRGRRRGASLCCVEMLGKFFVDDSDSKSRWYNPDKSNKAILARLERWLRMPWETKSLEWKQKYYQFIPLDDIIELLRSRYVK